MKSDDFTSLLQDHEIKYEKKDGKEHCFIDGQELFEFLSEKSEHKWIHPAKYSYFHKKFWPQIEKLYKDNSDE